MKSPIIFAVLLAVLTGCSSNEPFRDRPDMDEIYELQRDPLRPDHYLFDGGSVPLEIREATVALATRPLGRRIQASEALARQRGVECT